MTDPTCHYCGVTIVGRLTRDHVVPLAVRGKNAPWNIVPACHDCNQAKADRMPPADHVLGCPFCSNAVVRWTRGDQGPTRAERRQAPPGRAGGIRPDQWADRPDLAPLSPSMRALLLNRERLAAKAAEATGPAVRWDGMRWVWTGRKNLEKGG